MSSEPSLSHGFGGGAGDGSWFFLLLLLLSRASQSHHDSRCLLRVHFPASCLREREGPPPPDEGLNLLMGATQVTRLTLIGWDMRLSVMAIKMRMVVVKLTRANILSTFYTPDVMFSTFTSMILIGQTP